MIKVKALIERGNDGTYGIYIDLNEERLTYGILGDGHTVEEAIEDFNNSYQEMKVYYQEEGKFFQEAEFEFEYDTASFLSSYSHILSLVGLSRLTGINKGQLSHYVTGRKKPTKKTIEKIQDSIHKFGRELSQVSFV